MLNILEDWEREFLMEQIYIIEERELLFKELNERQPAKIYIKQIKKEKNDTIGISEKFESWR